MNRRSILTGLLGLFGLTYVPKVAAAAETAPSDAWREMLDVAVFEKFPAFPLGRIPYGVERIGTVRHVDVSQWFPTDSVSVWLHRNYMIWSGHRWLDIDSDEGHALFISACPPPRVEEWVVHLEPKGGK